MSTSQRNRVTRAATLLLALLLAAPTDAERPAEPLLLVTPEEARLPTQTKVANRTLPSDGPIIDLESPTNGGVYEGSFAILVEFRPGENGLPVDMGTLELEYKRAWGIHITSRVRGYIEGLAIRVAQAEVPRGRHTVEIRIRDVDRNLTAQLFTVTVR